MTMVQAARRLRAAGFSPPVCVAVHGLFAEGALAALRNAGIATPPSARRPRPPRNSFRVASRCIHGLSAILPLQRKQGER